MTYQDYQELRVWFIVDLFRVPGNEATPESQDQAVQAYLTALEPWVHLQDMSFPPRLRFTLFLDVQVEHEGTEAEGFSVTLSPEAEVYFCAWLRRRAFAPQQDPPV